MGEQGVRQQADAAGQGQFEKRLHEEVRALEYMLENGLIESGVHRIGAEQEVFLVDAHWQPAPRAMAVLDRLADPHFTTEVATFNLEYNLDPIVYGADCLGRMETELNRLLAKLRAVAQQCGVEILLTGILPTLQKSHLGLENMSPKPRYAILEAALKKLRGSAYELRLRGTDKLRSRHDSVMLEACNTSFQVHFQVDAEAFARVYNTVQVATAPVLAAAVNSPLVFSKRLWQENRIAVFHRAVDGSRHDGQHRFARVRFGSGWVRESILEIFREDLAHYPMLFGPEQTEEPFAMIASGQAPKLHALTLHNSTVYRWNRPCYGITDGKAHLRIENRVLPAGPTVLDQVANAAFWLGLVCGLEQQTHPDGVTALFDFADVRSNFIAAARYGLNAQLTWRQGRRVPSQKLILQRLLPLAREGLQACKINTIDAERYLGVIAERVRSGQTGAAWLLHSYSGMKSRATTAVCMADLTAAIAKNQQQNLPVHTWPLVS